MIKSKDEAESVNYRFIVSLNEENFQFSKWVAAPVVNKSLKRPRSREQKYSSPQGWSVKQLWVVLSYLLRSTVV